MNSPGYLLLLAVAGGAAELTLRDFKPRPMVRLPLHEVPRARFPVVDVHNHVNDADLEDARRIPPQRLLEMMDRCNVRTVVILTGAWGERLQSVIDRMVTPHPGRFMVFTEVDWKRIGEPGFSEAAVRQLEDAVRRGARGLKITKELGLVHRDPSGRLVAVDDPRADPIWQACGRLGIPVAIHVSDPDAFFEPVDAANERWEELGAHPDWSFHGPGFPPKAEILAARDRVFARHPGTSFVALHFGDQGEDLDALSALLDRHPNVSVEFGARQNELGRQPRRAREFFLRYSERILFGSDNRPSEAMWCSYFRWLETPDEYFDYWNAPAQGRWKIYGLDLPADVLEKVYRGNAERLFARFKGGGPGEGRAGPD